MMLVLAVLAGLILATAAVALSLRNLIHSALLLIATWAGVAGVYLWAGAEFVAFAQVLIYVGAVSMVVLFAVLLTRRTLAEPVAVRQSRGRAVAAILVGSLVAVVLAVAVLRSPMREAAVRPPEISVRHLGFQLMNQHAASLLVVGVLLTVALLGATLLASTGRAERGIVRDPGAGARDPEPSSNPAEGDQT